MLSRAASVLPHPQLASNLQDYTAKADGIRDIATLVTMAGNVALASETWWILAGPPEGGTIHDAIAGSFPPPWAAVPHPTELLKKYQSLRQLVLQKIRDIPHAASGVMKECMDPSVIDLPSPIARLFS